jgi:cell division protein FtsB
MNNMHERFHNIAHQPKNSCPDIDRIIATVENWASEIKAEMNSVRQINDDLRIWGGEWKDMALAQHDRAENLEKENEDLRSEIDDLKAEIREMAERVEG